MKNQPSLTAYEDVNVVVQEFLHQIQSILGDQFVGLYLYGSLALGDFDPQTSDIDFIVLTRAEISEEQFAALRVLHARFDQSHSPWASRIEAAYIPLAALHQPPWPSTPYPQIEKGTELIRSPLEIGWAFQRHTLREHGVIVAGPPPQRLADPVDWDEMREAAATILGGWQKQSREDPTWIIWARERRSQAFIVLTLCRIRYSLETGAVASKPAAGRWAKATLAPRWRPLVDLALANLHSDQTISDSELDETLNFLYDTALLLE